MNVSIRGVDAQVFREFRSEVVKEGINLGQAINSAFELWLSARKKKQEGGKSLLDLKPLDFGLGSEKLSSQVDELVYGMVK